MSEIKDVLLVRKYSEQFIQASTHVGGSKNSREGYTVNYHNHNVTFVFPGYGIRLREIPQEVIRRINDRKITDIVDIGGGGALASRLNVGDLVLSTGGVNIDGANFWELNRRPVADEIARTIATTNEVNFYRSPILTSRKIVARRYERIDLQRRTKCDLVQMEHYWFMDSIRSKITPEVWDELYFTHLEMAADAVPKPEATFLDNLRSTAKSIDICVLRNQKYLGKLKNDFLREFLK